MSHDAFCAVCLHPAPPAALRCSNCPRAYHLECTENRRVFEGIPSITCQALHHPCAKPRQPYPKAPSWLKRTVEKPAVAVLSPLRQLLIAESGLCKAYDNSERYLSIVVALEKLERGIALMLDFPAVPESQLATLTAVGNDYLTLVKKRLRTVSALGVHSAWLDRDETTPINKHIWAAARASVSAVAQAVEAVLQDRLDAAFCVVQPGHHNAADSGMLLKDAEGTPNCAYACAGGCVLHSVACALEMKAAGKRVFILDLDVHFGDGTAWRYFGRPSRFCASIHLDQVMTEESTYFPFLQGSVEERGGSENLLNLPLPRGLGDAEWFFVLKEYALPALKKFDPDLVVVSCGFDGLDGDPSEAGMKLTPAFYTNVVWSIREICPRICCVLEGGYKVPGLGEAVCQVVNTLSGTKPRIPSPPSLARQKELRELLRPDPDAKRTTREDYL